MRADWWHNGWWHSGWRHSGWRYGPACCVLGLLVAGAGTAQAQQSGTRDSTRDTVRVLRTPLAPVVTTADEVEARLEDVGFYRRKKFSGVPSSQFMTRDIIEKHNVMDLSQLLRRVKGRGWGCADGVLYVDGALMAKPQRDAPLDTSRFALSRSGPPLVIATPMPISSRLDQIPVGTVEAIEVYTGPSEIPVEYNAAFRQARCVVVVWTR